MALTLDISYLKYAAVITSIKSPTDANTTFALTGLSDFADLSRTLPFGGGVFLLPLTGLRRISFPVVIFNRKNTA